jgi:hypothetical protein
MEVIGQLHSLATLPLRKESPVLGGRVGPRTSVDVVVKRKNTFPASAENQTLVIQPMA